MEDGLEAELDEELGYSRYDYKNKDTDNSRNGHSSKTLRTSFGDVGVSVPRDRKGEFAPQVLKKNQTCVSQDIEEKILSMYAKGMTTGDIETHIRDIYGISVSDSAVTAVSWTRCFQSPGACEVLSVSYPRLPLLWQLILMWRRLFARRRHVSTIGYRPLSVNFSI